MIRVTMVTLFLILWLKAIFFLLLLMELKVSIHPFFLIKKDNVSSLRT